LPSLYIEIVAHYMVENQTLHSTIKGRSKGIIHTHTHTHTH
jgi:hypothetical protein